MQPRDVGKHQGTSACVANLIIYDQLLVQEPLGLFDIAKHEQAAGDVTPRDCQITACTTTLELASERTVQFEGAVDITSGGASPCQLDTRDGVRVNILEFLESRQCVFEHALGAVEVPLDRAATRDTDNGQRAVSRAAKALTERQRILQ